MASNYKLIFHFEAKKDLNNILYYIKYNLCNPLAAKKQIANFKKAFEKVCTFPEICPLINNEYVSTEKPLRKLIVDNYIVFYVAVREKEEIEVYRILYGMIDHVDIL